MATYLVTGANRGIGYEYCRQIQERGNKAIAVCREASKELKALGVRVEEGIDITSLIGFRIYLDYYLIILVIG